MYLFLDLEWYQSNPYNGAKLADVLQIACIKVDEKFEKEKSFFKIVRPKNIDSIPTETLKMLHLGRNVIEQAQPLEEVITNWKDIFLSYEVLVVWNQYTLELFQEIVHTHLNIKLKSKRVVILQQVLSVINQEVDNQPISFKKAMEKYHVAHKINLLHCAKHDVSYLKKLFCSMKYPYSQEYFNPISEGHFSRLIGSDIIHTHDCYYIQDKETIKKEVAYIEDLFKGYKLCSRCQNNTFVKQTLSGFEMESNNKIGWFSEEYVKRLCNEYDMKYHFSNGVIYIRTTMSSWRIYHNEWKITGIYHENYRPNRSLSSKKKLKYGEGFHSQKIDLKSYKQVIKYIYQHDQKFLTRNNSKQQRIEQLLKEIEMKKISQEVKGNIY